MTEHAANRVTVLLAEANSGRREAVSELFRLVYDELHAIAAHKMRAERPGNLLQTTALVNETYLRLFGATPAVLEDRKQFFSVAAAAMRNVLIDMARVNNAAKRGGRQVQVELEDWMRVNEHGPHQQVALQEGLDALAVLDERACKVIVLASFAGRSSAEIAELLGVTTRTVERDLVAARLFLKRYMDPDGRDA